jgi:hypothetical protein
MTFRLIPGVYVHPTPGGCYHAIATPVKTPERETIRALLKRNQIPALTMESLQDWSSLANDQQILALLHRLQSLRWIQGFKETRQCPHQPMETLLPHLLGNLGSLGKALLADNQGFYLATSGFPHEVAEELSALSAELANLHERRAGVLQHNIGIGSSAFGVINAAGNSQLGFWPLYIDNVRFTLVISGMPHLNHPDFVTLTWLLTQRYG